MKLENKIMLITYADSMGKNINELHSILKNITVKKLAVFIFYHFFPLQLIEDLHRFVMTKLMIHLAHLKI